jgi:hypothetical protein
MTVYVHYLLREFSLKALYFSPCGMKPATEGEADNLSKNVIRPGLAGRIVISCS